VAKNFIVIVAMMKFTQCIAKSFILKKTFSVGMTTFGNMANYSCDPGYELHPDNSVHSCQPDGLWSGMDPLCEHMNYAMYCIK